MEKMVQASEANRSFSRILREVAAGDSFVITSHGRAVARIVPAEPLDRQAARERLFERLKQVEPMNAGPWTRAELYE